MRMAMGEMRLDDARSLISPQLGQLHQSPLGGWRPSPSQALECKDMLPSQVELHHDVAPRRIVQPGNKRQTQNERTPQSIRDKKPQPTIRVQTGEIKGTSNIDKDKRDGKADENERRSEREGRNSPHAIPKFTPPEITSDPTPWKPSTYPACPSVKRVVGARRPPVPTRRRRIHDVSDGSFGAAGEGDGASSSGGSSEAPIALLAVDVCWSSRVGGEVVGVVWCRLRPALVPCCNVE